MRLKSEKKHHGLSMLLIIFIFLSFFTYYAISFVDKRVTPKIMNFASLETEKIVTLILNTSVSKVTRQYLSIDNLFTTVKNANGEISSIDFNPIAVNEVLDKIGIAVQKNLKKVEEGDIDKIDLPKETFSDYDPKKLRKGVIYEVPMGAVSGLALLSNLGPKIPVKFKLVGSVMSNVNTSVKPYGINNALIEVNIHLAISMQVNLPFGNQKLSLDNDVPVAIKMVQGTVPKYYQNGLNENSSILTIPVE